MKTPIEARDDHHNLSKVQGEEETQLQTALSIDGLEQLYAVCDRQSVYQLKLILKQNLLFDSQRTVIGSDQVKDSVGCSYRSVVKIPTKLTRQFEATTESNKPPEPENQGLLPASHSSIPLPLELVKSLSNLLIGFQWLRVSDQLNGCKQQSASPLSRAVELCFGAQTAKFLKSELPRWELYDDFLLFQQNAFHSKKISNVLGSELEKGSRFFSVVAAAFSVSHIARKGLIDRTDVARRPQLFPLYGTFRKTSGNDTQTECFDDAFWTATRFPTPRGPLTFVWAPSETMYSRGNSSEKCRIANLSNVTNTVVVDMCCGIGFFTFGYLKAGAAQVIGCEISPWAIEGLRRGAIANGISYRMLSNTFKPSGDTQDSYSERLLIFPASNELALPIYRHRATHVNLGLLPSSVEFLPQAVEALRPEGGWLHIHGELAVGGGSLGRQRGAEDWAQQLGDQVMRMGRRPVKLINIHWVKSIGPAKEHIVVELEVGA